MDDTIKTNDTNFDPYAPHTSEMLNDTIGAKETYDFHIGAPVIDNYVFDQYSLTVNDDGMWNMNKTQESKKNHLWKYNEDKILKEIEDYVTSTYGSHYCGNNEDYKDIQTIDLMAAKQLAANFCQANILKYGSRYGQKNGRNKNDLMKVIHYSMLLLHFDGHYSRQNNGLSEFR